MTSRRVYGLHTARTLLGRRPRAIAAAYVLGDAGPRVDALASALRAEGISVEPRGRAELDRLAGGGVHQGIVLEVEPLAELSVAELEALVLSRGRALKLLVLDGVEDPRNLGACLRSADATGIDAVLVPRARAASLTAAAQKTASGAAETVPLARVANLARMLAWLKQAGIWVVGADGAAERSLYEARFATPIALVLGGEGRGLRRLTRERCDELVAIPMRGAVESLNVSVAAALLMFELERQVSASGAA